MKNTSRRGYTLDLANLTLTLSAAFADAMNDPNSEEYALVRQFRRDFPRLRIVRKTHATPARYHNKDGSITKRNKHSGLTIERMERFMAALPNGVDYLEAFYDLRDKAEAMCASPYAVVSEWFMRQFPLFRSNPLFYLDSEPEIYDFTAILERSTKKLSIKRVEGEQSAS